MVILLLISVVFVSTTTAENTSETQVEATIICTFETGSQLSVHAQMIVNRISNIYETIYTRQMIETTTDSDALAVIKNQLHILVRNQIEEIFQNAEPYWKKIEEGLIPFAVAMEALKVPSPVHQLFGLDTLFALLQDDKVAGKMENQCAFGYPEFIRLSGQWIFSAWPEVRPLGLSLSAFCRRELLRLKSQP
jgi:hypothetical protein